MSSPPEPYNSAKDDLRSKQSSPLIGSLVFTLLLAHWRTSIQLLLAPRDADATVHLGKIWEQGIATVLIIQAISIITVPWIGFGLLRIVSSGRAKRNDLEYAIQQRNLPRRKNIATH